MAFYRIKNRFRNLKNGHYFIGICHFKQAIFYFATVVLSAESDAIESILKDRQLLKLVLKCYMQEPYFYENSRNKVNLRHPAMPILSFLQPQAARKIYTDSYIKGIGLTERFITYFFPQPSELNFNNAINSEKVNMDISELKKKIFQLLDLFHTQDCKAPSFTVEMEDEAYSFLQFHKNLAAKKPEYLQGWYRKSQSHLTRIAWGIHCWNYDVPHEHPITVSEMRQAEGLFLLLVYYADFAFSPIGLAAVDVAKKILRKVKRLSYSESRPFLQNGIRSSWLQQRIGEPKKKINDALLLLQERNELCIVETSASDLIAVFPANTWNHF